VIDVDIKGFFDNLSHELMMQQLQLHTTEKWVLLYAERWLKAGVEQENGSIAARTKAHRKVELLVRCLPTFTCIIVSTNGWIR